MSRVLTNVVTAALTATLLAACGSADGSGPEPGAAFSAGIPVPGSQSENSPGQGSAASDSSSSDASSAAGSPNGESGAQSAEPVVVDGQAAPTDGVSAADSMANLAVTPEGLTGPWQDDIPVPVPGVPGLSAPGTPAFPPGPSGKETLEQVLYLEGLLNLVSVSFDFTPATTQEQVQAIYDAAWRAAAQSGLALRGVLTQEAIDSGIDPYRPGPMEFVEVSDGTGVLYCLVDLNVWSEYQLSPAQNEMRESFLPGYRAIMGPCAVHAARWFSGSQ